MDADGKVLGQVSNYASSEQVLAAMQEVLRNHPEFNVPSEQERSEKDVIACAQIRIDLHEYDKARQMLLEEDSDKTHYLLGRLARFAQNWEEMYKQFAQVNSQSLIDDVRMEKAYRSWCTADFDTLVKSLKDFPKDSNRYSEARYYEGLAHFHLQQQDEAMAVWKSTITGCSQDRWIYRADWAYTTIKQGGGRGFFSTAGPRHSLLNRIGYMGQGEAAYRCDCLTRAKTIIYTGHPILYIAPFDTRMTHMPDLASALKEEIRRLAKKEIKAQVTRTKQATAQHRREIAALKRQLAEQEKKIKFLEAQERKRVAEMPNGETVPGDIRFSPRSVKSQRERLGLSAQDYGRLVGVSGVTIYNWEQGKSRPRKAQLAALAAVRGIGKREAMAKLELLG